ncbi:MAG: methyltransferase domain-containing protein [Parvibaculum sp.]|uniref:pseudaminic acid biosynthesis-associated methylase n=1 Tax=Parvibaculum sp. TaxID=2024848 RepID=UPI002AB833F9|nr:pseudaminic acid biosynthesis-associated methylase [Parvibaculum sp.]MDZ4379842.1 methyltransferase domain-containing protein [Parvibaculum sp.]
MSDIVNALHVRRSITNRGGEMVYKTEQENFWSGEFGAAYIERNKGERLINANIVKFSQVLRSAPGVSSVVELGCNIGLNLQALNRINKDFQLCGYEINEIAVGKARELGIADIVQGSIIEPLSSGRKYDLAFTSGVLIHINPDELGKVYQNLDDLSSRYILVVEYYNPKPVTVNYRGHDNRLFKRDFAGELIDKFGLKLRDYGFLYHRDNYFPQDDLTWFLLEK